MKEGPWELKFYDAKNSNLMSYIKHLCPKGRGMGLSYWYALDRIDKPCAHCHEYPNADIMTVWKLHNWEYIQRGVSH